MNTQGQRPGRAKKLLKTVWNKAQREFTTVAKISFVGMSMHPYLDEMGPVEELDLKRRGVRFPDSWQDSLNGSEAIGF